MPTISKLYDSPYVSGGVSLALNQGDLAIICAQWTWNTSAAYKYSTVAVYLDGYPIPGYAQSIAANGDVEGNYMLIAPYLAESSGTITIYLSPGDSYVQEQYIRLTVVKITPTSGWQFVPGAYLAGSDTQPRDAVIGSKVFTLPNITGDILIGIATSLNPNATPRIAWDAPATEQLDVYVNNYIECTVATQVSESENDAISYYESAGYYNGGVGVAVREVPLDYGIVMWM